MFITTLKCPYQAVIGSCCHLVVLLTTCVVVMLPCCQLKAGLMWACTHMCVSKCIQCPLVLFAVPYVSVATQIYFYPLKTTINLLQVEMTIFKLLPAMLTLEDLTRQQQNEVKCFIYINRTTEKWKQRFPRVFKVKLKTSRVFQIFFQGFQRSGSHPK